MNISPILSVLRNFMLFVSYAGWIEVDSSQEFTGSVNSLLPIPNL